MQSSIPNHGAAEHFGICCCLFHNWGFFTSLTQCLDRSAQVDVFVGVCVSRTDRITCWTIPHYFLKRNSPNSPFKHGWIIWVSCVLPFTKTGFFPARRWWFLSALFVLQRNSSCVASKSLFFQLLTWMPLTYKIIFCQLKYIATSLIKTFHCWSCQVLLIFLLLQPSRVIKNQVQCCYTVQSVHLLHCILTYFKLVCYVACVKSIYDLNLCLQRS